MLWLATTSIIVGMVTTMAHEQSYDGAFTTRRWCLSKMSSNSGNVARG